MQIYNLLITQFEYLAFFENLKQLHLYSAAEGFKW